MSSEEDPLAALEALNKTINLPTRSPAKPKTTATAAAPPADDDPLAKLESHLKTKPLSRPNTPKLARSAEEKTRKSAESASTPLQHELTPTSDDEAAERERLGTQPQQAQQTQQGGGWWGWGLKTANALREKAVEMSAGEEAQKWREQLSGNVDALRGLGGQLSQRALPTLNQLLDTLAPPISAHERLQIHITHDLVGYPALDPTIYAVFSRVMAQVEGGDLLVIQRGSEARGAASSKAGWSDGPWWRDSGAKRDLGVVMGMKEGTKLARVGAEAFAEEFFKGKGGMEEAKRAANEIKNEKNPVRSSDIFLAIQAVGVIEDPDMFAGATEEKTDGMMDEAPEENVCFAIYLNDPVHGITFHTVTQSMPKRWADWLDAENEMDLQMPADIAEIVQLGGIDPREWISEWMEEIVGLGVGVIAQKYVAKRMGVGEGGVGKGKARVPAVDSGAGELARAL